MNLKTVPYTRLLRLEVAAFAEDVIYIIKRNDPELLKIDKVYNMLVDQEPNLVLLTEEYGSHPLTKLIIPVRRKFIRYVRSIVYRMNLVVFEDANNFTTDVLEAQAVTQDYLYRLDRCRSEREKIGRVTGFLQMIDDNKEIKAAFTKFQLMGDIELLRNAHSTLKSLINRRTQSISENSHVKMRELTAPVIKALKNMFKQVEIAMIVNDELDYLKLFYELDGIITEFRNMVNRRLLHNKKKSEAKALKALKEMEAAQAVEVQEVEAIKPVEAVEVHEDETIEPVEAVEVHEDEIIEPVETIEAEEADETAKKELVSKAMEDVFAPEKSNMEVLMDNRVDDKVEKELNKKRVTARLSNNSYRPIKNDKRVN